MGKLRRWLLLPMTTTARIDDVDGGVRKRSVMTYVPPVAMRTLRMEVMAVEVFGKWRWVEIAMPHNSTETVLPKVVARGDYSYEDHPCSLVLWLFGCLFGSTSNYGGRLIIIVRSCAIPGIRSFN
jgi:hypothetical protein